jgi:hypothetical protein
MDEEWDFLIVLDACRYDYFLKTYKDFFDGELKKIYSPGSSTPEWCINTFIKRYDDVVYVSSNPHINSKFEFKGFNSKEHFFKIIDVWDWGWNKNLGTVHPKTVNGSVKIYLKKFSDKRFIIHYMQPHEPYIGDNFKAIGFNPNQIKTNPKSLDTIRKRKNIIRTIESILKRLGIIKFLDNHNVFIGNFGWKMREFLNLPPSSPMDSVRRAAGDIGLRKVYLENLKLVLKYVRELIKDLQGTIIITSDHGELLGEYGAFQHGAGRARSHEILHSILLEIPWLKIEKNLKA